MDNCPYMGSDANSRLRGNRILCGYSFRARTMQAQTNDVFPLMSLPFDLFGMMFPGPGERYVLRLVCRRLSQVLSVPQWPAIANKQVDWPFLTFCLENNHFGLCEWSLAGIAKPRMGGLISSWGYHESSNPQLSEEAALYLLDNAIDRNNLGPPSPTERIANDPFHFERGTLNRTGCKATVLGYVRVLDWIWSALDARRANRTQMAAFWYEEACYWRATAAFVWLIEHGVSFDGSVRPMIALDIFTHNEVSHIAHHLRTWADALDLTHRGGLPAAMETVVYNALTTVRIEAPPSAKRARLCDAPT